MPQEPFYTALLATVLGLLLALSVLSSRAAERVRAPLVLVFLLLGMLAGSEGIGGIAFDDYHLAYRLGTAALVLILFDGGLNTPRAAIVQALRPAATLATIGVAITALIVAVGARLLGAEWPTALVLGAVVSSTDAAAVFAVLRSGGVHLKRRVGVTLEVESGANDPMAVILTTVLVRNLMEPGAVSWWRLPLDVALQLGIGLAAGIAIGHGGRALLRRLQVPAAGLFATMTLALASLAFGVPTLVFGSGFLAVYVAGVVLGDGRLPYRSGLLRIHDAMAWLAQVGMFLMLGLLVFPTRLLPVAGNGLLLAVILALVARPIAVIACLAPFRYPWREVLFVSWVGLRGAVPIVLATFPVLAGVPGADQLFHTVFFIVVVSAALQGGTYGWLAQRLGLQSDEPPAPAAALEITTLAPLRGEIIPFHVSADAAAAGASIGELPFPDGTSVALVVRGAQVITPRGATQLQPGDHVYVLTTSDDRTMLNLIFGGSAD